MKLKIKFLPAILAFGVVALSSCEKNQDVEMTQPEFEQGTISHIMADSSEVTSFNYAGDFLSQINHFNKETGELESFEKFERDGKGRIVKSTIHAAGNHAKLSEEVFTYNEKGLLTKTSTTYYNGSEIEFSSYATYDYTTDKKLEKKSVFEAKEGQEGLLKSYTTYKALPNGNYVQEQQYVIDNKGEAKLFSTTTFSYDTNTNPMYTIAEPGTISSPNNLIASTAEVHGSQKTYKYTYNYTYDERGYPTSQAVITPSGKSQTYKYLYSN